MPYEYNDCINRNPPDSGCKKCYCYCPEWIRDNMDMGCGGCCYESPKLEEEEENEED